MAETTTYKNTNVSGTAQPELGRDVSSTIWHETDSRNTPINVLLGGDLFQDGKDTPKKIPGMIGKEVAKEFKYEVLEKDALARSWVGGAASASTSEETIAFVSTTGMQAGMILREKNKSTPEIIHVITVSSATSIEAKRNIGSTTYTIPASQTYVCVGFCQIEGGSKRGIRNVAAAARTRYLQVFRNTFGITLQLQYSDEITNVKSWPEEMRLCAREHSLDKEHAFWFGPNADSTTDASGYTCYLSRSITAEIENYNSGSNVINCGGTFTENSFLGPVSQQIFDKGSSTKLLLADGQMLSDIMEFGIGKLQLQPSMKETDYGLSIGTLISVHGVYKIIHQGVSSHVLHADEAGYGLVLDPDYVKYKYTCLLYTSPSPRDGLLSRMPSSA